MRGVIAWVSGLKRVSVRLEELAGDSQHRARRAVCLSWAFLARSRGALAPHQEHVHRFRGCSAGDMVIFSLELVYSMPRVWP